MCVLLALVLGWAAGPGASVRADEVPAKTLVVSRTFNGYARAPLADGTYPPVTYALGNLGLVDDQPVANDSLNRVGFAEVSKVLAVALRGRGFVPATDPASTQQLILVWYGNTRRAADKPTGYPLIRSRNARILGFQEQLSLADTLAFSTMAADFYQEFDAGRYFVVLKAYDFQVARRGEGLKLLWESRFSVERQGEDFAAALPRMAGFAALTFGRETRGILDSDRAKGNVELGDMIVLETVP